MSAFLFPPKHLFYYFFFWGLFVGGKFGEGARILIWRILKNRRANCNEYHSSLFAITFFLVFVWFFFFGMQSIFVFLPRCDRMCKYYADARNRNILNPSIFQCKSILSLHARHANRHAVHRPCQFWLMFRRTVFWTRRAWFLCGRDWNCIAVPHRH